MALNCRTGCLGTLPTPGPLPGFGSTATSHGHGAPHTGSRQPQEPRRSNFSLLAQGRAFGAPPGAAPAAPARRAAFGRSCPGGPPPGRTQAAPSNQKVLRWPLRESSACCTVQMAVRLAPSRARPAPGYARQPNGRNTRQTSTTQPPAAVRPRRTRPHRAVKVRDLLAQRGTRGATARPWTPPTRHVLKRECGFGGAEARARLRTCRPLLRSAAVRGPP